MTKRLEFITKVNLPLKNVINKFNANFFKQLLPPFSWIDLKHYDGTHQGGQYQLTARFTDVLVWEGEITSAEFQNNNEYVFVDEVKKNSAGIAEWKHIHRFVEGPSKQTYIVDEISFKAKNPILEKVLEIGIRTYFIYRQFLYKKLLKQ